MLMKIPIFFAIVLSVNFFCMALPNAEKINSIQKVVQSLDQSKLFTNVEIASDPNFAGPAYSKKINSGYVIAFNHIILRNFSDSVTNLIGFHELGHIYLGHCDNYQFDSVDLNAEHELEADYFAAFMYKRFEKVDEGLLKFIELTAAQTQTNPAGNVRAQIFRSILDLH
jgi:hypothetical protein